jgi:heme-degrading monooxygenase HmoA
MFVVTNQLSGHHGHGPQDTVAAFQRAMAGMKQLRGFLGLELWTAEDGTMQTVSRWESREAFDAYINSDLFKHQHAGTEGQQRQPQTAFYTAQVPG